MLKNPETPPLWTRDEVEKICGGKWIVPPPDGWAAHGFTYYPNQIRSGDLAMTTSAPSWPKKSFKDTTTNISQIFSRGAAALITDRAPADKDLLGPLLLVEDTREAMDRLGGLARQRMTGKVVCVTGSAGKTSTKDALGFVLGRQAPSFAAPHSYNTHYGVPLHLAQTPPGAAYAIYEVAVSTVKGITRMAEMLRPHVGLITNVHDNHLDVHKSVHGLALAKAQIFSDMAEGGTAVLNRDDGQFPALVEAAAGYGVANIVSFGVHEEADARLVSVKLEADGSDVEAEIFGETIRFRTGAAGRHWAINSLGILACVHALGADVKAAAAALADFATLDGRGKVHVLPLPGGTFQLMNDSFNATPASMEAGFETASLLAPGPGGRRVAVLGEIGHLGEKSEELHRGLAKAVDAWKFDRLFTIGKEMVHLHNAASVHLQAFHANSLEELYAAVLAYLRPGDVVYVKGSLSVEFRVSIVVDHLIELERAGSPMKFLSATHLIGANRYAQHSVMARALTLGNLSKLRSGQVGGDFTKRLLDHLPRIGALPIAGKKPSGFLKRLQSQKGALLDEVLLHATLAFEDRRVEKAVFARVLDDAVNQQRLMVWSCRVPVVARQASRLALRLIRDLLPDNLKWSAGGGEFNFMEEAAALRALVKKHRLHPDDALLGQSAEQRDIPWEPLGNRFALLGQGKFQKRIRSAVTSETRHSGAMIAGNKRVTNKILGELRLPVPRQEVAESEVEALAAAKKIGFPVAVKPLAGHEGQGVSANLAEADEVSAAFSRAGGRKAIVESFIEGDDHRLLVVGGRMLAAAKKIPPSVTGDGKTSIQNLVKNMNRHHSRDGKKLFKVKIGDELMRLLGAAGHTLDTVLKKGEKIVLCSTANFSTGGIPIDVTDKVHPDNRRMAVRAAEAVGLDVAGIDFLTPDISRSYKKVTGAILEVNALPGLRLHYWPAEGVPRDVTGPIVDSMFPPGAQSRVPIAVISGRTGRNYTAHVLAHILQLSGQCVGLSSQKGVFVGAEPLGAETLGAKPLRGQQAARAILRDPRVESMVRTVSPMEMLKRGLGHDACEAMAILNVSKDGEKAGAEELAETERGIAIARDAARGMVIVNAEDPAAIKLAGKVNYRRIVMVSRNAKNKVVRRHIGIGGDAVVLEKKSEGATIVLYVNGRRNAVLPVQLIPAIGKKSGHWALRGCLYGLALAHGMGVALEVARCALRTLGLDFLKAPAPVRVRDDLPFRVIVGKIENKAALRRFAFIVSNWPCKGRKLAIIPKDVKAPRGEAKLLKGAFRFGKNLEADISKAFSVVEPDDLVVVLAVDFDRCWRAVSLYAPETPKPPLKKAEKAAKPSSKRPPLKSRLLWTAKELAAATGGKWISLPDGFKGVDDVSFSWTITKPGDLVMTTNPEHWGTTFQDTTGKARSIFKAGAAALMTNVKPEGMKAEWPVLLVENTRRAIMALGQASRKRLRGKVICVTGSVGKSSTKEGLAYVLGRQGPSFGSPGNHNSSSGVPLSLSKTPRDRAYAVYEFSIGRPKRLLQKTRFAKPHVGIITQVQPDHLMYWGDVENVADAKSQIFDGLEPGGTAVLYHGMMCFERVLENVRKRKVEKIIVYGDDPSCDVRLLDCRYEQDGSQVKASVFGEEISYRVSMPGRHVVLNSLAVLSGVYAVGADWRKAAADLASTPWPENRAQCSRFSIPGGAFTLIDDAYSANPESMRAAFDLLSLIKPEPGGRRLAVLGEIKELGDDSIRLHAELAAPLKASGVERVFTMGDDLMAMREKLPDEILGVHGKSADDVADAVAAEVRPGDVVLVKGSERTQENTGNVIKRLKALDKSEALAALADEGEVKLVKAAGRHRGAGRRLEVLFVGDTSFGENYQSFNERKGLKNILKTKGYDFSMAKVKDAMIGADLVIANLETPVTNLEKSPFAGKKSFVHWADVEKTPKHLLKHNVSIVSLANNHTYDFGDEGFEQTLRVLRDKGITFFGAGDNDREATAPFLLDADVGASRFRMAVFASFAASKAYREKFTKAAGKKGAGLDLLDTKRIAVKARALKAADPDILIVAFPHWGANYKWRTERQDDLANKLFDAGVDLIIGHGAHMLQEVERRDGRWVVFSLGNFVFNSLGRYDKMGAPPFSLAAKLVAEPDSRGVSVTLRLYPIVTDNRKTAYQTRFVTEGEFAEVRKLLSTHASDPDSLNHHMRADRDRLGPFLELQVARKDNFRPQSAELVESVEPVEPVKSTALSELVNGLSPAVPIEESAGPNGIVCLEDGKSFKALALHLKKAHGMKPKEYFERWGLPKDYPMTVYKASKMKKT